MVFLVKKVVSQFLMPVPLVTVLAALGCLLVWRGRRRLGRGVLALAAALFVAFGYGFGFGPYLYRLERQYPALDAHPSGLAELDDAQVMVLGQGCSDKSDLPLRCRINASMQARLLEGERLFRQLKTGALCVSLASEAGSRVSQAFVDEYAAERGLDRRRIRVISEARDTEEEARLGLGERPCHCLFLVSSASHLSRAVKIFKREYRRRGWACTVVGGDGLSRLPPGPQEHVLVPVPCDYLHIDEPGLELKMWPLPLPSVEGLSYTQRGLYEWLGNCYESLRN